MAGFEFQEMLAGSYHLLTDPGEERPMSLTLHARVRGLRSFLVQAEAEIVGEIDLQGFADHRAFRGRLQIKPVQRKLVYEARFEDNKGRECRFHGEKELEAIRPVASLTTLPGSVWSGERELARALLRFDPREDLVRFLRSVKPR